MTQEEELQGLREENAALQAQVAELLPLKEQVEQLKAQVKQLTSRLAKDSHNSHLPPSSDRFARKKKTRSLRNTSGKKPGGQPEHPGETIQWCSRRYSHGIWWIIQSTSANTFRTGFSP